MNRAEPGTGPSTTRNPIVAVGRKVKSVLSTHQRPSIRILREPTSREESRPLPASRGADVEEAGSAPSNGNASGNRLADARNRAGAAVKSLFRREETLPHDDIYWHEYDPDEVDLLDVVDPEVSTLSTLTNVQNSLFIPSVGRILNRRPAYRLTDRPGERRTIDKLKASLKHISSLKEENEKDGGGAVLEPLSRTSTMASTWSDSRYAVLPHGETLEGWTREDKEELNDLVRHMLHSRRARFRRSMKGFWQYVRRPLGLFVTVYATLITLFGAAWVLFLIGWISIGSKRDYVINIVDNVLVALFAIIGDGLAPFRAVDTCHMIYIAHYHRLTWKKREKLGLPKLMDHNDLPDQRKEDVQPEKMDIESLVARKIPKRLAKRVAPRIPKRLARRMVSRSNVEDPSYEYSVLSKSQQAKLEHHERKFSKSHTFYKPHETETHHAFPLKLLVAVVVLLDCHSLLQISLGACTWGISYKTRPFALTTVILCCSITCNILGGVLISVGDKRTRKKDVIERMMRQELTGDAIEEMRTRRLKEAEQRGEVDPRVRKDYEERKEEAENEEIAHAWKGVPSLPKKLLGKGEDHRQPSLPQKARTGGSGSSSNISRSAKEGKREKKKGGKLGAVREDPVLPAPPRETARRGAEPEEEGFGSRVIRLIRRADMDRS